METFHFPQYSAFFPLRQYGNKKEKFFHVPHKTAEPILSISTDENGGSQEGSRQGIYVLSFTSMGVNMGAPNRSTNRWHLIKKA